MVYRGLARVSHAESRRAAFIVTTAPAMAMMNFWIVAGEVPKSDPVKADRERLSRKE